MPKRIYEAGVDTETLFRIDKADDGYFAVRDANPRFCFWGETILQAVEAAVRGMAVAQRIVARSAETNGDLVQPEGREPGPKDAPKDAPTVEVRP